jgi:hypothetical protein
MTSNVKPGAQKGSWVRRLIGVGTLGVVACGACCALPFASLIAGGATLTVFGWCVDGGLLAALAAGVAVLGSIWFWRHRKACRVPACGAASGG